MIPKILPTQNENTVDVCRCLTEPGNSDWSITNIDACRVAISKEIGVHNWVKVNFSQNPNLNGKFDELSKKCTITTVLKTRIEGIDKNTYLVKEIDTSYGYIWDRLNNENQILYYIGFC
jgi:hypothetical protein